MTWTSRVVAIATAVVVLVLAFFVWPTPYRYFSWADNAGESAMQTTLRVNRFTGATAVLTPRGWATVGPNEQVLRY